MVNQPTKTLPKMSLALPREKRAGGDFDVARRVSTDKLFRGPHTTTLLIFRLTPVIMAVHNRLCKRILAILPTEDFMTNGPVTLEQVAQAAGVSPSTASRALAGKARQCRISVNTERAILQAAKGLGFQASHVA